MKTIIDVVNYFQAEWPAAGKTTVYDNPLLNGYHFGGCITSDTICTAKEFNSLVTDLSSWQPTLPKVETVEHDGMVYEIGKLYMFKDSRAKDYFVGVLVDVDNESGLKFCTTIDNLKEWYQECEEVIYDIGTITPAPTKLIDGEAYMFDYESSKSLIGILHTSIKFGIEHRMFCMPKDDAKYNSEFCTNIITLSSNK